MSRFPRLGIAERAYGQLGQRLLVTNALNLKTRTDHGALIRVVQTVSGNGFVTGYSYARTSRGIATD